MGREQELFLSHCQPATALEYLAWLLGYLSKGGRVTHEYDYEFPEHRWVVLCERPAKVPQLYGARARCVVVPRRLDFAPDDVGDAGHSKFFFMDGYQVSNDRFIPSYGGLIPEVLAN